MNNDLISRSALKIEIEKQIAYCEHKLKHQSDMEEILRYSNTSYGLRLAHNYVENAPTVDERQQGEWKLVSDINNNINVVCPFCNEYRIIGYAHGYSIEEVKSQLKEVNDLPKYCENCGARMRVENDKQDTWWIN